MTPDESLISTRSQDPFQRAFKISLFLHLGILALLYLKSVVLPSNVSTREYLPSLRVDLVALPDQKRNETLTPGERPEERTESVSKKTEISKPDDGDFSLKKKKSRQERMKNALAKIKSLEKIREGQALRGNKVLKGSSSRGVVNESIETTYYDVLLEKIRGEWELPQWLKDRGFSAKVLIKIDRRGMITSVQFLKASGNEIFDSAVRKALQASTPFPVPPLSILAEVSREGVVFGFPIAE